MRGVAAGFGSLLVVADSSKMERVASNKRAF